MNLVTRVLIVSFVLNIYLCPIHGEPDSRKYTFDEISIKREEPNNGGLQLEITKAGRFRATHLTVVELVQMAFELPAPLVVGGPKWLTEERFTVNAVTEDAVAERLNALSRDARKTAQLDMLKDLLQSRFGFRSHWERRNLSHYKLISGVPKGQIETTTTGYSVDGGQDYVDIESAQAMATLARFLTDRLHVLVVDETGIKGAYKLHLKWGKPEGDSKNPGDPELMELPAIKDALKQQLGLILKHDSGAVRALAIDDASIPSPE
ncbi:TIGR03435 family protein [Terriglobus albidus]|uniref:TIGR03435 family protein n=1 Tax=Terriglobus albidus TaxID=1592106 RepID=UPI0021E0541E|nr:TIGR03435 family protein [Terriglobus albidus]